MSGPPAPGRRPGARIEREHPFETLLRRPAARLLSPAEIVTGRRLIERAWLDPAALAADLRRADLGGRLTALLVRHFGFGEGLEAIERAEGWTPRSAKMLLAVALERLAAAEAPDHVRGKLPDHVRGKLPDRAQREIEAALGARR